MDTDAMFGYMNQQLGIAAMLYMGNREYPVGSLSLANGGTPIRPGPHRSRITSTSLFIHDSTIYEP